MLSCFNEKETQNQINFKKSPTSCKSPLINFEQVFQLVMKIQNCIKKSEFVH